MPRALDVDSDTRSATLSPGARERAPEGCRGNVRRRTRVARAVYPRTGLCNNFVRPGSSTMLSPSPRPGVIDDGTTAAHAARGRGLLREPALARGALVGVGLLPAPGADRRRRRPDRRDPRRRGPAVGPGLDAGRLAARGLDARPPHPALVGRSRRHP